MLAMMPLFRFPLFGRAPAASDALPSAPADSLAQVLPGLAPQASVASRIHPAAEAVLKRFRERREHEADEDAPHGTLLRAVGWTSAAVGAVTLGVIVGREIRLRYKINRRTPYDFYAHAGDERDLEFGVGI